MKRINIISGISLLLLLIISSFSCQIKAQQDSEYTQYMYNTVSINPAYAGNRKVLSFNSLFRSQWVGLDGAPSSLTFSANSPLGERGVGIGFSIVHDQVGPSEESNLALDFSYTIPINLRTKLSFGLKGGLNLLNVDFTKLQRHDPTEPEFMNNIDNRFSPTVGFGLFLNHDDRWYLGLSSPNILSTEHYDTVATATATEKAHVYLIAGYVLDINRDTRFKPAILTKAVQGAPVAIDFSANFLLYSKFTLGVSYRLDAAISGLAGFQINERLMLGYAYDFDTTPLGDYNSGSHDLFLRFELGRNLRSSINPRFF